MSNTPAPFETPPLDPDSDQAREWVLQEMTNPAYRQSEPTWWDIISMKFLEWVQNTFRAVVDGAPDSTGDLLLLILGLAAAALIIWAIIAASRRTRVGAKSNLPAAGVVFDNDERSVRELREAANRAAEAGNFTLAVEEQFRALARMLFDRTLIALRPGSTAQDVARRAAVPFPGHDERLRSAAISFDRARYLDQESNRAEWQALRDLDAELERARPQASVSIKELEEAGAV